MRVFTVEQNRIHRNSFSIIDSIKIILSRNSIRLSVSLILLSLLLFSFTSPSKTEKIELVNLSEHHIPVIVTNHINTENTIKVQISRDQINKILPITKQIIILEYDDEVYFITDKTVYYYDGNNIKYENNEIYDIVDKSGMINNILMGTSISLFVMGVLSTLIYVLLDVSTLSGTKTKILGFITYILLLVTEFYIVVFINNEMINFHTMSTLKLWLLRILMFITLIIFSSD